MGRTFSEKQKNALYIAQNGKCAICGRPLPTGWHADHVIPWRAGGKTDVVNGQALCPECNLKKGGKMHKQLRPWQERFMHRIKAHERENFLLVAVPASGKTFASAAAIHYKLKVEQAAERVLIVVPNLSVRKSWSKACEEFGMTVDEAYQNSVELKEHFDGMVVTFQSIDSEPMLYRRLLSRGRWMVVIDEVHHLGEQGRSKWGESAMQALEPSLFRVLLSGTPFRTDGRRIPFVPYRGRSIEPDFEFSYDEAVRPPEQCVRKVYFKHYAADVEWEELDSGNTRKVSFEDNLDDNDANRRLSASLRYLQQPSVVGRMIQDAHDQLVELRKSNPKAGGMVLCIDTTHAHRVAEMMRQWIGIHPVVATSEDADAHKQIENFREGSVPWLVSVQMVSEGTDIPRLQVGVYATRTTTELFWRQAVGRFIRSEGGGDATVYHVDDPRLLQMAQYFTRTVDDVVLEDADALIERGPSERDGKQQSLWRATGADGELSGITHEGENVKAAEIQSLASIAQQFGLNDPPERLAFLLRSYGISIGGDVINDKPEPPQKTAREREDEIRATMKKLVGRIVRDWGVEYAIVNAKLNESVGISSVNDKRADEDTLRARLRNAREWVKTGVAPV